MQCSDGGGCLVHRHDHSLIGKLLIFVFLLAALAGITFVFPFLFELTLPAVFGSVYWLFFRQRSESVDQAGMSGTNKASS